VHNWEILLQNAQGNHNKHFRKLCEIVTTKANVKRKQTENYVGSEKVKRRKLIPISVPPLEVRQQICPTLIGSGANDRIACLIAESCVFSSSGFTNCGEMGHVGQKHGARVITSIIPHFLLFRDVLLWQLSLKKITR